MIADMSKDIQRSEGKFNSVHEAGSQVSEPTEIFYQSWSGKNPRATLVVTHGISEHSESYAKTAEVLVPMGWDIIAWDLRGHGRSGGKRGYVAHFSEYTQDLKNLLSHLKQNRRLQSPFALLGHSMGGLVTLDYLAQPAEASILPKALLLSSPLLGVAITVPPLKDMAARILAKVAPTITLFNEIRYQDLTRDPEFLKSYPIDSLRHEKISPTLYLGMFDTIEKIKSMGDRITLPCLVQAAGQEKIVSLPAIKDFFPKLASKTKKLIVYENSYHEIFNDLDRAQVFNDLNAFLVSIFSAETSI
jgi:alpha-beta hydrolase superfamily lysophospholipase